MIIVDYSGIAMAAMFTQQKSGGVDEALIRHQILNSIRMYNVKYRDKFGELILACDGGSWRKHVFAEYKGARKKNREEDAVDWDAVWEIFNKVKQEIIDHLPYRVVQVKGAEADDVIAALTGTTQEFGCDEDVMIISADKDFIQLQKYGNVKQFSPLTKKLVTDKNPRKYLIEHILRGCGGDGVPNVLSDDDTFINEDKRQKPLRKPILENWVTNYSKLDTLMDEDTYRNFVRNRRCIDFEYIPEELVSQILEAYGDQEPTPNSKVLTYLISKRCNMLIGCAADFFPPKQ